MKKNIKVWLSIAFTILIYSIVPVFADVAPISPLHSNTPFINLAYVFLIISLSFIGIAVLIVLISTFMSN